MAQSKHYLTCQECTKFQLNLVKSNLEGSKKKKEWLCIFKKKYGTDFHLKGFDCVSFSTVFYQYISALYFWLEVKDKCLTKSTNWALTCFTGLQ